MNPNDNAESGKPVRCSALVRHLASISVFFRLRLLEFRMFLLECRMSLLDLRLLHHHLRSKGVSLGAFVKIVIYLKAYPLKLRLQYGRNWRSSVLDYEGVQFLNFAEKFHKWVKMSNLRIEQKIF